MGMRGCVIYCYYSVARSIPKTLPEVPTKPGETIEEAELEEVADADSTITLTNL